MDPLTVITETIALGNAALILATKIWDATPPDLQKANAADWAKFTHGIGTFITDAQAKINSLVK